MHVQSQQQNVKKVWNIFKVNMKVNTLFWCLYYLLLTYLTPFCSVYIAEFEQVMFTGLDQIWRYSFFSERDLWKKKKTDLIIRSINKTVV